MKDNYNIADFMDDLTAAFMPMRHESEESAKRWGDLMMKSLRDFSSQTLRRACEDMQRNRQTRGYPSIAECIKACEKAARFEEAHKPRELEFETVRPGDAARAYDVGAKTFRMLAQGKPTVVMQAAEEDCINILKAFVIRKGRFPNSLDEKIVWFDGEEPHSIRQENKRFLEAYESCVKGGWKFNSPVPFESFGDQIMQRREKLRAHFLR